MSKWSTERTVKFLEIYEQYPCLWDTRIESFRDREMRKDAYEKIAYAMQLDDFGVLDVRSKIRTLRNTYTLELAKILRSKKSGALEEDVHKPKAAWFPVADRFFSKIAYTGKSRPTAANTRLLSEDLNISSNEVKQPIPTSSPLLEKRFREDNDDELHSVSSRKEHDDYDIFGAFVATELRELGDKTAVKSAKKRIQYAIIEAYEALTSITDLPPPINFQQTEQISPLDSVNANIESPNNDPNFATVNSSIIASEESNGTSLVTNRNRSGEVIR